MTAQATSLPFSLPNLYRIERRDLAERLYARLVSHLVFEHRYAEAVVACRRIRSFGRRSVPPRARRDLHFSWEIESLLALNKPASAWRQYRLWLRHYPKRIPVSTVEERVRNAPDAVRFEEVPIRYAAGRWEEGRLALEAYLRAALRKRHITAYELLFSVYNEDSPEPTNRCRVTLAHLYSKLGRPLERWSEWRRWIDSLHPALFRLAGVSRSELLANSGLLPRLYQRLMEERARRSDGSGVTFGQPDLVDNERKVRKRHEAVRRRQETWAASPNPLRDELNAKVRAYFPLVLGDR